MGSGAGRLSISRKVTTAATWPSGTSIIPSVIPASLPRRQRRQAHQDRIDIAAGSEAEQGAAIVDQVELRITAAPGKLDRAIRIAEGRVHPPPHQLGEDIEEGFADVPGEGENMVEGDAMAGRGAFEMVVEYAADAALDLPVGNEEIFLRPFAEAGIISGVVGSAGGAQPGVE